ncbi:hypothetical protein Baya_13023 [Bagarius yarrelli]|uniref:Uncharacterized protein n=1 Tax=Bagarius yarrelli TaxID=175774 RepID=A0A556V512_BAGYA|nr:hypothetical protein Baya_13023 [Bagarius yarrelli]
MQLEYINACFYSVIRVEQEVRINECAPPPLHQSSLSPSVKRTEHTRQASHAIALMSEGQNVKKENVIHCSPKQLHSLLPFLQIITIRSDRRREERREEEKRRGQSRTEEKKRKKKRTEQTRREEKRKNKKRGEEKRREEKRREEKRRG